LNIKKCEIVKKTEICRWAEKLTKEVYDEWKRLGRPKAGFKVFYGPVRKKPKLMIISLNPGNSKSKQDHVRKSKDTWKNHRKRMDMGDFSLSKENGYLASRNPFGKRVMELFEGNENVVKKSVTTTILFFRSHDLSKLKQNKKKYASMKDFANKKIIEILDVVKPKKILIIGNGTFSKLKKIQEIHDEKILKKFGLGGRIMRAKTDQYDILVLPHLTSARGLTKANRKIMRQKLRKFIK
tara:strand:+ start:48 stop:764 length:717 start_codon:yes stop_codon:yes gene_type:complete